MQKIYFAGSIRGGREDAAIYAKLIAMMKEENIVLTEHIGAASLSLMGEEGKTDEEIYQQDTAWLRECDIVIAECSTTSLGVGYELAYAEAIGKPVHVFYRKSRGHLSAMITGDPYFHIHYYETEEELFTKVRELI